MKPFLKDFETRVICGKSKPVLYLTSSVPNLELDLLSPQLNGLDLEVNPNG